MLSKIINFKPFYMRKTKFTEVQILKALKEYENGRSVNDICRELNIHQMTLYRWKKVYSGMDSSQITELKALREENMRLKAMYAEMALDNKVLKDVLSKKF
jgi:putative transposase